MRQATVAIISSFVMAGAVGLRASGFALERLGLAVHQVPTVILPWHPGIGPATRTMLTDMPAQLAELATHARTVDAVFTGYFANPQQTAAAAAFIDAVRAARSDVLVLVDPVCGDERGRYVPETVVAALRADLLPRADILTPNIHELGELTGASSPAAGAAALDVPELVVTSVPCGEGVTGAAMVSAAGAVVARHALEARAPRGTGDLFAALLLGKRLQGAEPGYALRFAAAGTLAAVRVSHGDTLRLPLSQMQLVAPPLGAVELAPLQA